MTVAMTPRSPLPLPSTPWPELADFLAGPCSYRIMPRRLSPTLVEAAEAFGASGDALRARIDSVDATARWCRDHATPEPLSADVARLHAQLALLAGNPRVDAELFVTTSNDCAKFHVDWYAARVLCTYLGPGTEVVPDDAVNRTELGVGGNAAAANARIVTDPARVLRAGAGDVVFLRGALSDRGRGGAAVHRSPPVADVGLSRVVVKLTTVREAGQDGAVRPS